jgi:hypothetical protein
LASNPLTASPSTRRVVLEDERHDFLAEADLLRGLDPFVGVDQREVAAEQHLFRRSWVLAYWMTCLGKYLGDQPERSMKTLSLCSAIDRLSSTHGQRGVGEDDLHVGKVDRDVVDQHRLAILEPHAAAALHPRAHARMAGVEDGRQLVLGDHLVDRIGHPVIGVRVLHRMPWNLKPLTPWSSIRSPRLARAVLALVRVDRWRRRCRCRSFFGASRRISSLEMRLAPVPASHVDREHARSAICCSR